MRLIVTDNPTRARRLWTALGKSEDWIVTATGGFVADFPPNGLGVETRKGAFTPSWKESRTVESILEHAKKASEVLLVFDPDIEGDFNAGYLQDRIRAFTGMESSRVEVRDLSKEPPVLTTVTSRFSYDAASLYRVVSRVLAHKTGTALESVLGSKKVRVDTISGPLLGVVVENARRRTREGRKWEIRVGNTVSRSTSKDIPDGMPTQASRKSIVEPPKPLNLADYLVVTDALGLKADDAIASAYQLYAGGFVTWPYTHGRAVTRTFSASCVKFLASISSDLVGGLPETTGDECLRPTSITCSYTNVPKQLQLAYKIIWSRTLSAFSVPIVFNETEYTIDGTPFAGTTRTYANKGYAHLLLGLSLPCEQEVWARQGTQIKAVRPPLLRESSLLVQVLEWGASAYAAQEAIADLVHAGLVRRSQDGCVRPTALGTILAEVLEDTAPELLNPGVFQGYLRTATSVTAGKEHIEQITQMYRTWIDGLREALRPDFIGEAQCLDCDTVNPIKRSGKNFLATCSVCKKHSHIELLGDKWVLLRDDTIPGICSTCNGHVVKASGIYGPYAKCATCNKSDGDIV